MRTMRWTLNSLFALGLVSLISLEFYPQLGKAFHQENPHPILKKQYSEKTINTFLNQAFGQANSRNGSVLRKWKDNIRVKIHKCPDATDRQFLKKNINIIDTLIGPGHISLIEGQHENANLHIHIIPRSHFSDILPHYQNRHDQPSFSWCQWNGNSEIFKATILIDQHLNTAERHNQLLLLIGRNLGLTGLSLQNEHSVFSKASHAAYSPIGTSLIQLLYENIFLPGMTAKKARKQLSLADAVAFPNINGRKINEKKQ